MSTLTHWGHSCVRFELPGGAVVVDPGAFSDLDRSLPGAVAVLVTHEHQDHVVPADLVAHLAGLGSSTEVHAPQAVVDALVEAGLPAERAHAVSPGDRLDLAGGTFTVVGGDHAVIHPDIPGIANVGFLLEVEGRTVLHPGDAFVAAPEGVTVDTLLVPVGAPWLKLADTIDWVRSVAPRRVVPIHEAVLSGAGRQLASTLLTNLGGAGEPVVLEMGESTDL
ncbi:MBL fold metallo-hydrolase [Cellulomonas marina]|nr:MBL fold metallo-hydrolase [Cellulomonas marina]